MSALEKAKRSVAEYERVLREKPFSIDEQKHAWRLVLAAKSELDIESNDQSNAAYVNNLLAEQRIRSGDAADLAEHRRQSIEESRRHHAALEEAVRTGFAALAESLRSNAAAKGE